MTHEPIPVSGASELALACRDRRELRECTEFYCETLGFPLVTAWAAREDSNYGEPVADVGELDVEDVKGDNEVWVKAGSTLVGLWLPREQADEADRPPDEWDDVWDRGGRHVHYALEVPTADFDAVRAELERRGVAYRQVEHEQYGGARSLFVRDPAGNVLEFAERALRRAVEAAMPPPEG